MLVYETARTRVRYLEDADLPDFYAICSDPVAMKYMGDGEPLTEEQTVRWIKKSQANYADHGYGCMAVISKENDEFIGFCGLVYSPDRPDVEIIYALAQRCWGRGLASEVAAGMIDFGFNRCGLTAILATIDPQNEKSSNIAEKLGMTFLGERPDEDGVPVLFYQIERQDSF